MFLRMCFFSVPVTYIESNRDMHLMRKQVAVEVFVKRPSGQFSLNGSFCSYDQQHLMKNIKSSMT